MKEYQMSMINAVLLILLGLWGYFGPTTPSATALIPVIAGTVLLLFTNKVKAGNRTIAHFVVMLTLVMLLGLIKPLTGAIGRSDHMAVVRVIIMMISCMLAMIWFVLSFISARKARRSQGS